MFFFGACGGRVLVNIHEDDAMASAAGSLFAQKKKRTKGEENPPQKKINRNKIKNQRMR